MAEISLIKFPSDECHLILLIIINIGSGNSLLPSGIKLLPELMLTQIPAAIGVNRPQWVKAIIQFKVGNSFRFINIEWLISLWNYHQSLCRFWTRQVPIPCLYGTRTWLSRDALIFCRDSAHYKIRQDLKTYFCSGYQILRWQFLMRF